MSDVDIEDTINRIKNHKSVQGIVIVNSEGVIVNFTTFYVYFIIQINFQIIINLPKLNQFQDLIIMKIIISLIVSLELLTQMIKKMRVIQSPNLFLFFGLKSKIFSSRFRSNQ